MTIRLLTGDCRAMLATLPDASVQLCVTSPPYFGLRDYGTASWEGGDAACDHKGPAQQSASSTLAGNGHGNGKPLSPSLQAQSQPFGDICGKCGATRVDQQIGLEPTVEAYVAQLVAVFREVRRVLRDDGVLFLNLGDSYTTGSFTRQGKPRNAPVKNGLWAGTKLRKRDIGNEAGLKEFDGLKTKDLIGIPWRVAFALQQPWLTCRGCGTENHLSQWASFPNGRRICPACELSKGHDISESGWYLRSDIIWVKPNPMPESVKDRCTKSHEYIFHLTKSPRYFWDAEAVGESTTGHDQGIKGVGSWNKAYDHPGDASHQRVRNGQGVSGLHHKDPTRNVRSVWTIATKPFSGSHFAVFPDSLAERCIKAGTSEKGCCSACRAPWVRTTERETTYGSGSGRSGNVPNGKYAGTAQAESGAYDIRMGPQLSTRTTGWQPTCPCAAPIVPCVVLDPFGGAGTVSLVAERLGRDSIYVDLSPEYAAMAKKRIYDDAPIFANVDLT